MVQPSRFPSVVYRILTLIGVEACLVLPVAARAASTGEGARWTSIGPSAQDVQAVALAPASPATLLAGTSAAGLFRSVDGGRNWRMVGAGLPARTPVAWLGIAADPAGPALALAGGVPYLSNDGGGHWQRAALGLPVSPGLTTGWISTDLTPTAMAGGDAGLFRSQDGGLHWQRLNLGQQARGRVTFVTSDPANARRLLVGVSNRFSHGGRVFTSSNGGDTWREMDRGLPADTVPWQGVWSATRSNTAWVAAGIVFRTDDGGSHWRRDALGLPPHAFAQGMVGQKDDALFVALSSGVFRRDPTAAAWSAVTAPWRATALAHQLLATPDGGVLAATGDGLFAGDRLGLVWRDWGAGLPSRANVYALLAGAGGSLYAGGDDGVWRRGADGQWTTTGPGLPVGATVRALLAVPGPPPRVFCATDYGVYFSSPTVDRWTIARGPPAGRGISAIAYAQATDTVYAALADGGIYAAPASTLHWRLLAGSRQLGYVRVLLADQRGRWLLANGSRSDNGGRSWHAGPSGLIAAIQVRSTPGVVLAGTAAHGMLRSVDGGLHWAGVAAGVGASSNIPALTELGDAGAPILFAIADGMLIRSDDAGSTWHSVAGQEASRLITSLVALAGVPSSVEAGTLGGGVLAIPYAPPAPISTVSERTPTASATASSTAGVVIAPTWTPIATSTPTASITSSTTPTGTQTPTSTGSAGMDTPVPPVVVPSSTATATALGQSLAGPAVPAVALAWHLTHSGKDMTA